MFHMKWDLEWTGESLS